MSGMLLLLGGQVWPLESGPRQPVGMLQGSGTVRVDQQALPSGAAVFGGDVVATGKASTALVSFRSGTLAAMGENSQMALLPQAGSAEVDLRSGLLVVRSSARQKARVRVAGASVLLEDRAGATCVIASRGRSAEVFGGNGRVEIRGPGKTAILRPGKYAQIESGGPQAAAVVVGKVVASLPEGWVQHEGFAPESSLVLGELVNQDDRVRTSKQGRIRIQLLDTSSLTLGPRTTIEISAHDPETQHTQVDLKGGTLLADVIRPPQADSSFLLRTPAALIRVAQGSVVVDARAAWSDVCVLSGSATVRGSMGSPAGTVAPRPNECTRVIMNEPPSHPAPAAGLISSLRKQTDFLPNTEAEVLTPIPMGAAGLEPQPASLAVKATAATSTGAAVLSAIAFLLNGDAQSGLQRAAQQLKGAASAAGQAAAEAQAAQTAATSVNSTAAQVLQSFNTFFGLVAPLISPSAP